MYEQIYKFDWEVVDFIHKKIIKLNWLILYMIN